MIRPCDRIIALILAAVLITACSQASTSTPLSPTIGSPTIVLGTPTSLPTAPPSPEPIDGAKDMPNTQPTTGETQIRVIIGDTVLTGRLWDNAPARDLIAQLPLTLKFSDYHGQEKPVPLPRELSIDAYQQVTIRSLATSATTNQRAYSSSTTLMSATSTAS